jgi:hypothetical protein
MRKLLLLSLLLVSFHTKAEELSMATDVGKLALTNLPCKQVPNQGFIFEAYATENDPKTGITNLVHQGCWTKTEDIVSIWFYKESPPLIAQYKDYYFKKEGDK